MLISLIAPIYNEEKNIQLLTEQIDAVMHNNNYNYELILVNDGSKDRSLSIIKEHAILFPQIRYISCKEWELLLPSEGLLTNKSMLEKGFVSIRKQ